MHRRVASLWAACLIFLFCVGGVNAQERTDLIDAPLWPLFLGGPLKTIALEINATGDLPPDFAVAKVELECLAHLRAALAAISDIRVVRYIDVLLNREMPSDGIMVVVQYSVTLKAVIGRACPHWRRRLGRQAAKSSATRFGSVLATGTLPDRTGGPNPARDCGCGDQRPHGPNVVGIVKASLRQ